MKSLVIPTPRLANPTPGLWRVAADIAGQEIFFEASVPLAPRIESWVCSMTLPAMRLGLDLDVREPLSPVLIENLSRLRALARRWWPQLRGSRLRCAAGSESPPKPGRGLFFTGGVDSSYALFRLKAKVNPLIFVEGFDVALTDAARLQKTRAGLERVAHAAGVPLTVVRTNLRSHPVFRALNWEITHIAALAAVAHALGNQLGTVYVAASDVPPPYGSHPDLDKLWSSGSVALVNFGAEYSRLQRVAAIRDWPPLRGCLRVCWQNQAATLNCGYCEKCLRTRLELRVSGAPDGMDSFPDLPLVEALDQLQAAPHDLDQQWREIHAALKDDRLQQAIVALLARSVTRPPPPPGWRQRAQLFLKRLAGGP